MTREDVESMLRDPEPKPFWPTPKPGVTAALEAVLKAEGIARTSLLAEHRRHFSALRRVVEDACEADGGHDVEQVPGNVASLGDRWCATCRKHFPRWTEVGRNPSKGGDTGEPHDDMACNRRNGE